MKDFEDIVPPLELCLQIPKGAFDGTIFVWERVYGEGRVQYHPIVDLRREALYQNVIAPAPTLEEIFKELPRDAELSTYGIEDDDLEWIATCYQEGARTFGLISGVDVTSLSTATLKLWLELDKKTAEGINE